MPPDHGDRVRTVQDGRHLYRTKDPARRPGSRLHLSDVREVLRRRDRAQQHGQRARRYAGSQAFETRRQVLPQVER